MTKGKIVWALAVINTVLLGALLYRSAPEQKAQAAGGRIGDYIMIPGKAKPMPNSVVYVIDVSNNLLGAVVYDDTRKSTSTMQPIDLTRVFQHNNR